MTRRVALVLGGSGDIGAATALALAQAGCDIVVAGRGIEGLQAVATEAAHATGAQVHPVAVDLKEEAAADRLIEQVIARCGRLDILVGAAAEFKQGTLRELSAQDWTDGFAAMFFGAVRVVKAAWPHLMASKGHVVLVTGVFAIRPLATGTLPGAIAAALLNFSKSAAEQGMKDGVSVNAVLPGPVAGRRFHERLDRFAAARQLPRDEALQAYTRALGVDRVAEPQEIASMIAYLVSPAAAHIRGASMVIDGGMSRAL